MQSVALDASDVEIQVKSGEVTLSGTICDRREKYQMEELADSIPGVKEVTNQLRIKRANQGDESGTSDTSNTGSGRGTSSGTNFGGKPQSSSSGSDASRKTPNA